MKRIKTKFKDSVETNSTTSWVV